MIPIECPKCGRGGSVPPDRLNARLVCKACHCVFHLDNTGRMVMGEPQSFDMKSTKSRADDVSSGLADFNLAQTWSDIPNPVKFGIPAALLLVFGYMYMPSFGGSGTAYESNAATILRAVANNNKSKAVSYASKDTSDEAGQWFDLLKAEVDKLQIGSDVTINPQLFAGDAEKDNEIVVVVTLAAPEGTGGTVMVTLPMLKEGEAWKFDGSKSLEDIVKAAAAAKTNPKSRK